MNKRNVATLLWFLMGWSLALVLAAFAGLPSILAPVLAIGLGALVRWDPNHLLWPSAPIARRVRPMNELAHELENNAANRAVAGSDRTRT